MKAEGQIDYACVWPCSAKNAIGLLLHRRRQKLAVVAESMGAYGLLAVFLGKVLGGHVLVRVKGFVYQELAESNPGIRTVRSSLKATLNRFGNLMSLRYADRLVPISSAVGSHLSEHGHSNISEPVTVSPRFSSSRVLPGCDLPTGKVITVTNFNFARKVAQLPSFLRLLQPEAVKRGSSWMVHGDGNHRCEVEERVLDFISEGHLEFTGEIAAVEDSLAAALVHVYVSNQDTVSSALLESFALGVPCLINIDFPVIEIRDAVLPDQLLDLNDPEMAVVRFRELCENVDLRKRVCARQYQLLDETFSREQVRAQLAQIFLSLP